MKYLFRACFQCILAIILFAGASCEKFLAIPTPNDKLATEVVFSDSASASLAVSGVLSRFTDAGFLSAQVRWAGFSADELVNGYADVELEQIATNNIHPDNTLIRNLWSAIYEHLYQINSSIEGIGSSDGIAPNAAAQLMGELRFLRAYVLFYAVNNWGDVPLPLTPDYRTNEQLPRASSGEVYGQIVDDLRYSVENLPLEYIDSERARPNKLAAMALLARVYLYREEWELAAQYAAEVIGSDWYWPLDAVGGAFLKESKETIWQLFPASLIPGIWTYDGNYFVPPSLTNEVVPYYLIPEGFYDDFEADDLRKAVWIGVKEIAGANYYFPYKYKVRSGPFSSVPTEYTKMLRLSEQLLIRAEAYAKLGNLADAIDDLNVIRQRAGLNELPMELDSEQILAAVAEERKHELLCEWGHRWFDLKRTHRADAVLAPIKGANWQQTDTLWPIPQSQLLTNPNLVQNDGY